MDVGTQTKVQAGQRPKKRGRQSSKTKRLKSSTERENSGSSVPSCALVLLWKLWPPRGRPLSVLGS